MSESYLQSLLGDREKIIRISRQHWFRLISAIFLEIVLILIIFAVTIMVSVANQSAMPIIVIVGIIALLFPLATMIRDILIWSHHMIVVTNRRIMKVTGIFNKNVIDSSLEKVNDIKMRQSALGRMFNYGDIEILTASEMGANLFRKIDDPIGFKTAMLNAKDQLEHGPDSPTGLQAQTDSFAAESVPAQRTPMDVPALINQLAQLRQQGIITEEEFLSKKAELLKKI
ncbi:MAG: hypothetical protein A2Z49_03325 [Chloroflexi bacterium RBG_19FT_COMBO_56_12]|nr:MAG: hypothetical protein A2Z49_03325 [Chloroflexi bacterium RBG_19FT_COMBO_56_12]